MLQDPSLDRMLLDLIRDGARTTTLEYLTGISGYKIRCLWERLMSTSPPNGRLVRPGFFLQTKRRQRQASILAQIFLGLAGEKDLLTRFYVGYRMYLHLVRSLEDRPLRVDHAATLFRSLEEGKVTLIRCHGCRAKVLVLSRSGARDHVERCCFCHTEVSASGRLVPFPDRAVDSRPSGHLPLDKIQYSHPGGA